VPADTRQYHYLLGFDHFVLHQYRSTDGWQEVLAPFIAAGLVEVHDASHVDGQEAATGDLFLDPCARGKPAFLNAKARHLSRVRC